MAAMTHMLLGAAFCRLSWHGRCQPPADPPASPLHAVKQAFDLAGRDLMEGPGAPSTSGRAMFPSLSTLSLLVGMLLATCALASAQWVVETNSFHIREPANVEGEYDSAIGDVSSPAARCPKIQGYTGVMHACCACSGSNNSFRRGACAVLSCMPHYARRALKSI